MKLLITTACIASLAVTQITFAQGTVAQLAQIARGDVTLAPDNASQTQHPSPSHPRPETPAEQTEARSFHEQLDQLTSHIINGDPELRSILGLSDDEYGDLSHLMSDVSLAKRDDLRNYFQQAQHQLSEYDRGALEGQERWSYDMAAWINRTQSDLLAFDWSPAWMPGGGSVYAVDQLFSIPVLLPQFMQNHHSIDDYEDAENYISRLKAIGVKLDQVGDNFTMQAEAGVIPPAVALQGAAAQLHAIWDEELDTNFYIVALREKLQTLNTLSDEQHSELMSAAKDAVVQHTNPAYERLLARVNDALANDPPNHGVWALPQGGAYYQAALRWHTSTDLDAEAIHQLGIDEVARVEVQMDTLLRKQGLTDGEVGARMSALAKDPRYSYPDSDAGRAEIIADVEAALERLEPFIPTYFNRIPEQPLQVSPVPRHAEDTAPGGYYYPPAMDGSRPGTFFINLGDIESNTRWSLPTLAYHEGAPGHHFQIALNQTLSDLPLFRLILNPSPFTEGWALYAEQLVAEMGLYEDDPLADLGRLQAEMFRSVRLVVDTGLHHKRWSPQQAETYMIEKTGMNPRDVRAEINRYLVQPGQATSYKIGHLTILRLRQDAQAALGEHFDLRQFHDVVLGNGALPLLVLEQVIVDWLAEQQSVHATT